MTPRKTRRVLAKAVHALAARVEESLNLSQTGLGDSDFWVLEVLLHKEPLPVNTIGPVDRLENKALVKRKNTGDGGCAWSSSRRKGERSSPRPFGYTQPRWKKPPGCFRKASG